MTDREANRFSARAARYARVGANMSGVAARIAGARLFGLALDRGKNAIELAAALGGLKGPIMKVAQLLATIPDALPPEYAAELMKLQSEAPPRVRWRSCRGRAQARTAAPRRCAPRPRSYWRRRARSGRRGRRSDWLRGRSWAGSTDPAEIGGARGGYGPDGGEILSSIHRARPSSSISPTASAEDHSGGGGGRHVKIDPVETEKHDDRCEGRPLVALDNGRRRMAQRDRDGPHSGRGVRAAMKPLVTST